MSFRGLITPVILSGGAGTRLWPSSRDELPKQFLPLIKGRSTFESTLDRIARADVFADPLVLTGNDFRFLVADVFARTKRRGRIVLEPMRRDSGPAIGVAAELIQKQNPDSVVLVLAADHLVTEIDLFVETVMAGFEAAKNGAIVTFGIPPEKPSSAYGYVEPGEAIDAHVHKVRRFQEKPTPERAASLIEQGCLWNSGNFLFRSDILLAELATFEPAIARAVHEAAATIEAADFEGVTFEKIEADVFARSPSKSIDFAVMERTQRAAMIKARFSWSDLGSWESLWEASEKDAAGNAFTGSVSLANVTNSYVLSQDLHTAVVGLDNIAVVATHDAVLVAPRQVSAELKPLVAALSEQSSTKRLTNRHRLAKRQWGSEDDVVLGDGMAVRVLTIEPGQDVQLASHAVSGDHLIIIKGEAQLSIEKSQMTLVENQAMHIEPARSYQIANAQGGPLQIVHVQRSRKPPEEIAQ